MDYKQESVTLSRTTRCSSIEIQNPRGGDPVVVFHESVSDGDREQSSARLRVVINPTATVALVDAQGQPTATLVTHVQLVRILKSMYFAAKRKAEADALAAEQQPE